MTSELVFTRTVEAPRDLVFDCMTSPEHLAAFWGPLGTTSPAESIEVELRPGGRFTTVMVNEHDGSTYTMRASYDEVTPPDRLAWTDLDTGLRTTVTFDDLGDGRTGVRIRQTDLPPGFDDDRSRSGFLSSLDRFDRYLAALTPRRDSR